MTSRARLSLTAAFALAGLVGGCATTPGCAGLAPRDRLIASEPTIHPDAYRVARFALQEGQAANTACWASRGDKFAQFALGYAFEKGIGTEIDRDRARGYYEQAARSDPAYKSVYSAPVGTESYGSVISVPAGQARPGLPEAVEALRRLGAPGDP